MNCPCDEVDVLYMQVWTCTVRSQCTSAHLYQTLTPPSYGVPVAKNGTSVLSLRPVCTGSSTGVHWYTIIKQSSR